MRAEEKAVTQNDGQNCFIEKVDFICTGEGSNQVQGQSAV